jgi:putative FmdB family regulatory protein
MPTYTYLCDNCNSEFELFFYIKDYIEHPTCSCCNSKKTLRQYVKDVSTQSASVKKSDSELKTIGDLAQRNSDRMSDDEKYSLYMKHNSYKEEKDLKPLPSGMSRMKKGSKIKWPGTTPKAKRKPKNG